MKYELNESKTWKTKQTNELSERVRPKGKKIEELLYIIFKKRCRHRSIAFFSFN